MKYWAGRAGLELPAAAAAASTPAWPGLGWPGHTAPRTEQRLEEGWQRLQSYTVTDNGVEKWTILYEWNE